MNKLSSLHDSWSVRWSEAAVGTWPRFLFLLAAQIGGFLLACWMSEWRHVGLFALFALVWPLAYLVALRGMVVRVHRQQS